MLSLHQTANENSIIILPSLLCLAHQAALGTIKQSTILLALAHQIAYQDSTTPIFLDPTHQIAHYVVKPPLALLVPVLQTGYQCVVSPPNY